MQTGYIYRVELGIWVEPDGLEWASPKICRAGLRK